MSILDNIRNKRRAGAAAPSASVADDAQASVSADVAPTEGDDQPEGKKPRKRRKIQISNVIAAAIMLIGLAVIAYPTFADWWNSYHQQRIIASYTAAVESTDQETLDAMIAEAEAYNQRLLTKSSRYVITDEDREEYESLLNLSGDGVMGYIQINSLGINLPIYHGVDEDVLQHAIGHIEGTSLPVGGMGTHAAVSGHRGLPSAKLFSDLDKLVEGDTFTITIFKKTLMYQVDQIRIVEPENLSDLNIYTEGDLVTLVTCTPYGVNTHRLLVRGHRIDNIAGIAIIPPEAVQIPNYIAVPAVGVPMLFVYLIGALIYYRITGRGYDREKVMAELEELSNPVQPQAAPPQPETPAPREEAVDE